MGVLLLWRGAGICGLPRRDRACLLVVVHGEQSGCGRDGEKRDGENAGQVGPRCLLVVEGVVTAEGDGQVDGGMKGDTPANDVIAKPQRKVMADMLACSGGVHKREGDMLTRGADARRLTSIATAILPRDWSVRLRVE